MLKCPKCGTENKLNARFCNECACILKEEIRGLGTLGRGAIIGRYHIIESISIELGEALYRVEDRENDCHRYVKEILRVLPEKRLQAKVSEKFEKEVEKISKIKSSSLPKIIDSFTENGGFYSAHYIVFDYVEGISLDNISREENIKEDFAVNTGRFLCDAMNSLHNAAPPVFSFNLSPANILLKTSGNILLTDIPISRGTGLPQKVEFIAPERFEGKADRRSDIYSIGAILHNILTNIKSTPFIFKPLKNVRPDISQELINIITRSLRLKPEKRFENLGELKKALESIGVKKPVITIPKQIKPASPPQAEKKEILKEKSPLPVYTVKSPEKFLDKKADTVTKKPALEKKHIEIPDSELLNWSFQTGDKVSSSCIIAKDTLYTGSDDKNVYALDIKDGKEKWRFETGSWVSTTPAFYQDRVYVGARDGKIYSINAFNGKKEWEYYKRESIFFSPSVSKGNLILGASLYKVGNYNEVLLNLDADTGKEKWTFSPEGSIFFQPLILNDIVYFTSEGGKVYALDIKTGKEIWKFEVGGRIYASPVVYEDILYITCEGVFKNGIIHLLNADDGRHIWQIEFEKSFRSSISVGEDVIYATSLDKNVYAIDLNQRKIKWKYETKGGIRSNPVLHEGIVYTGSDDGILYALDKNTGKSLWQFKTGGAIRSNPTIEGSHIFFGSRDGRIYSLQLNEEDQKASREKINIQKEISRKENMKDLLEEAKKEFENDNIEKAKDIYHNLIENYGDNSEALLHLARIYLSSPDRKKPIIYYKKVKDSDFTTEDLFDYAKALLRADAKEGAEEVLKKAEKILTEEEKNNISIILTLGDIYKLTGKFNRAIECYEKATKIKNTPESYIKLGKVYSLKGDFEEASLAYELALEMDNTSLEALIGKIQIKIVERDFSSALELIKESEKMAADEKDLKKIENNKARVLLELGNDYLSKDEIATATKYFEDAENLELSPHQMEIFKKGKANIFFKLAEQYSDEENLDLAIKFYKMCEEIYPGSEIAAEAAKKRKFRE